MAGEGFAYEGRFSKSAKVVLNVLPHEGRVPPMHEAEGRLEPLDARVDYTMNVAAYR